MIAQALWDHLRRGNGLRRDDDCQLHDGSSKSRRGTRGPPSDDTHVVAVGDSGVTIRVRMKTLPLKQ